MSDLRPCDGCKAIVDHEDEGAVCQDGYCRACHKSINFDDCVSGEWARRVRAAAGLDEPIVGTP